MVHACNDRGAIMEQLFDIIVKIAWPVYPESLNPLLVQLSQKFSRELMHNDSNQGKAMLYEDRFGSAENSIIWLVALII